jgi:hypothetical protein
MENKAEAFNFSSPTYQRIMPTDGGYNLAFRSKVESTLADVNSSSIELTKDTAREIVQADFRGLLNLTTDDEIKTINDAYAMYFFGNDIGGDVISSIAPAEEREYPFDWYTDNFGSPSSVNNTPSTPKEIRNKWREFTTAMLEGNEAGKKIKERALKASKLPTDYDTLSFDKQVEAGRVASSEGWIENTVWNDYVAAQDARIGGWIAGGAIMASSPMGMDSMAVDTYDARREMASNIATEAKIDFNNPYMVDAIERFIGVEDPTTDAISKGDMTQRMARIREYALRDDSDGKIVYRDGELYAKEDTEWRKGMYYRQSMASEIEQYQKYKEFKAMAELANTPKAGTLLATWLNNDDNKGVVSSKASLANILSSYVANNSGDAKSKKEALETVEAAMRIVSLYDTTKGFKHREDDHGAIEFLKSVGNIALSIGDSLVGGVEAVSVDAPRVAAKITSQLLGDKGNEEDLRSKALQMRIESALRGKIDSSGAMDETLQTTGSLFGIGWTAKGISVASKALRTSKWFSSKKNLNMMNKAASKIGKIDDDIKALGEADAANLEYWAERSRLLSKKGKIEGVINTHKSIQRCDEVVSEVIMGLAFGAEGARDAMEAFHVEHQTGSQNNAEDLENAIEGGLVSGVSYGIPSFFIGNQTVAILTSNNKAIKEKFIGDILKRANYILYGKGGVSDGAIPRARVVKHLVLDTLEQWMARSLGLFGRGAAIGAENELAFQASSIAGHATAEGEIDMTKASIARLIGSSLSMGAGMSMSGQLGIINKLRAENKVIAEQSDHARYGYAAGAIAGALATKGMGDVLSGVAAVNILSRFLGEYYNAYTRQGGDKGDEIQKVSDNITRQYGKEVSSVIEGLFRESSDVYRNAKGYSMSADTGATKYLFEDVVERMLPGAKVKAFVDPETSVTTVDVSWKLQSGKNVSLSIPVSMQSSLDAPHKTNEDGSVSWHRYGVSEILDELKTLAESGRIAEEDLKKVEEFLSSNDDYILDFVDSEGNRVLERLLKGTAVGLTDPSGNVELADASNRHSVTRKAGSNTTLPYAVSHEFGHVILKKLADEGVITKEQIEIIKAAAKDDGSNMAWDEWLMFQGGKDVLGEYMKNSSGKQSKLEAIGGWAKDLVRTVFGLSKMADEKKAEEVSFNNFINSRIEKAKEYKKGVEELERLHEEQEKAREEAVNSAISNVFGDEVNRSDDTTAEDMVMTEEEVNEKLGMYVNPASPDGELIGPDHPDYHFAVASSAIKKITESNGFKSGNPIGWHIKDILPLLTKEEMAHLCVWLDKEGFPLSLAMVADDTAYNAVECHAMGRKPLGAVSVEPLTMLTEDQVSSIGEREYRKDGKTSLFYILHKKPDSGIAPTEQTSQAVSTAQASLPMICSHDGLMRLFDSPEEYSNFLQKINDFSLDAYDKAGLKPNAELWKKTEAIRNAMSNMTEKDKAIFRVKSEKNGIDIVVYPIVGTIGGDPAYRFEFGTNKEFHSRLPKDFFNHIHGDELTIKDFFKEDSLKKENPLFAMYPELKNVKVTFVDYEEEDILRPDSVYVGVANRYEYHIKGRKFNASTKEEKAMYDESRRIQRDEQGSAIPLPQEVTYFRDRFMAERNPLRPKDSVPAVWLAPKRKLRVGKYKSGSARFINTTPSIVVWTKSSGFSNSRRGQASILNQINRAIVEYIQSQETDAHIDGVTVIQNGKEEVLPHGITTSNQVSQLAARGENVAITPYLDPATYAARASSRWVGVSPFVNDESTTVALTNLLTGGGTFPRFRDMLYDAFKEAGIDVSKLRFKGDQVAIIDSLCRSMFWVFSDKLESALMSERFNIKPDELSKDALSYAESQKKISEIGVLPANPTIIPVRAPRFTRDKDGRIRLIGFRTLPSVATGAHNHIKGGLYGTTEEDRRDIYDGVRYTLPNSETKDVNSPIIPSSLDFNVLYSESANDKRSVLRRFKAYVENEIIPYVANKIKRLGKAGLETAVKVDRDGYVDEWGDFNDAGSIKDVSNVRDAFRVIYAAWKDKIKNNANEIDLYKNASHAEEYSSGKESSFGDKGELLESNTVATVNNRAVDESMNTVSSEVAEVASFLAHVYLKDGDLGGELAGAFLLSERGIDSSIIREALPLTTGLVYDGNVDVDKTLMKDFTEWKKNKSGRASGSSAPKPIISKLSAEDYVAISMANAIANGGESYAVDSKTEDALSKRMKALSIDESKKAEILALANLLASGKRGDSEKIAPEVYAELAKNLKLQPTVGAMLSGFIIGENDFFIKQARKDRADAKKDKKIEEEREAQRQRDEYLSAKKLNTKDAISRKADIDKLIGSSSLIELFKMGSPSAKYSSTMEFAKEAEKKYLEHLRTTMPNVYGDMSDIDMMNDYKVRFGWNNTVASWIRYSAKKMYVSNIKIGALQEAARLELITASVGGKDKPLSVATEVLAARAEHLGEHIRRYGTVSKFKDADGAERERLEGSADIVNKIKGYIDANAKGRFHVRTNESNLDRVISPRVQQYWKIVKDTIYWSDEKVQKRINELTNILGSVDPSAYSADIEFTDETVKNRVEAELEIRALINYGGLIGKLPGEVEDALIRIAQDIDGKLQEHEEKIAEKRIAVSNFNNAILDAQSTVKQKVDDKFTGLLTSLLYFNMPNMFDRFRANFAEESPAFVALTELERRFSESERLRVLDTNRHENEFVKAAERIFGKPFAKIVNELSVKDADLASRFSLTNKESLSRGQLMNIYLCTRQGLNKGDSMYKNNQACGRDDMYFESIKAELTEQELAMCDWMSDHLEIVRQEVSPVAKDISGVDLLFTHEQYFPVKHEHDDYPTERHRFVVSRFPGFLIPRSGGKRHLDETRDAFRVFSDHLNAAMKYKNYAHLIDFCHFTLWTKEVCDGYTKAIGREARDKIYAQLADSLSLGVNEADNVANSLRRVATAGSMWYNVTSSLKQIVDGIPAFGLYSNPLLQAKGFMELMYSKEAWSAIGELKNAGILKARLSSGISEPLDAIIKAGRTKGGIGDSGIFKTYAKNGMILTTLTDSIASLTGGSVHYRLKLNEYLNQGMAVEDAKRMALADADIAINLTQASSRQLYLHEFQRGTPWLRTVAQFLGPALLRVGREVELAHRAFFVETGKGKVKAFKKLFSAMAMGHVVIPTFLTLLDYGMQMIAPSFPNEDEEDLRDRMIVYWASSMLAGPFSGMLFFGDAVVASGRTAMSKVLDKPFMRSGGAESLIPSFGYLSRVLDATGKTFKEFYEASPMGDGDWKDAVQGVLEALRLTPAGNLGYKVLRKHDALPGKDD